MLIFLVGAYHHQTYELRVFNLEPQDIGYYNDTETLITFYGKIIKEPDVRENNTKLTIDAQEIQQFENTSRTVEGKVLLTVSRYPEYNYGDELEIIGELKTPHIFEDFNYKDYLAKQGIYSVMYYPQINKMEGAPSSPQFRGIFGGTRGSIFSPYKVFVYKQILGFKNKLRNSIYQNLSPPQSSILGAIILGDKQKISEEWKNKFNITGIRHITCVSGMHIVILGWILMWLGIKLGLWRGQAFYFAIIFLLLFIIMVGLPASAIRAGIMAGIFLFAQKIGRLKSAGRAIVFAAVLMLIYNPLSLMSDIGFQLSFLASLGIIYLMPIFQEFFAPHNTKFPTTPQKIVFHFKKVFSPVNELLAMTFAAQIFTLPILIYNFGYISQIAPIVNVLVVPLLPFVMVLGFVFGLVGIFCQQLALILSFPVWLLLTYILKVVDWFSGFKWACFTIENVNVIYIVFFYIILACVVWLLRKKQKIDIV